MPESNTPDLAAPKLTPFLAGKHAPEGGRSLWLSGLFGLSGTTERGRESFLWREPAPESDAFSTDLREQAEQLLPLVFGNIMGAKIKFVGMIRHGYSDKLHPTGLPGDTVMMHGRLIARLWVGQLKPVSAARRSCRSEGRNARCIRSEIDSEVIGSLSGSELAHTTEEGTLDSP